MSLTYRTQQKDGFVELVPRWGSPSGFAVVSYLKTAFEGGARLGGHSNVWEARVLVEWFLKKRFLVHVLDFNNRSYLPDREVDVVLDIESNLSRLKRYYSSGTIKIMHLTGSFPRFQNEAELSRIQDFKARHGVSLLPRRQVYNESDFVESIHLADACSLLGNAWTLSTYPTCYRQKISLIDVSASQLLSVKSPREFLTGTEYLWFFGGGAVHKGLDLVIDAFSKLDHLTLNIVGDLESESDFFQFYKGSLKKLNIRYWGYLDPSSDTFNEVARKCFSFIAPSCSESMSAACATLLRLGLFPVLSRQTGIDLPLGAGFYLETLSVNEIIDKIGLVEALSRDELHRQIRLIQQDANKRYCRENFKERTWNFLDRAVFCSR